MICMLKQFAHERFCLILLPSLHGEDLYGSLCISCLGHKVSAKLQNWGKARQNPVAKLGTKTAAEKGAGRVGGQDQQDVSREAEA